MKKAREWSPDQIHVGLSDSFERDVSEQDILRFAEVSGDLNPLHVDAHYAGATNFRSRIAHGAFQVAMASEFIGMYVPGLRVLLSSLNAKFIAPLFYPTRVRVSGVIAHWDSASGTGSVRVTVVDLGRSSATAEINLGVALHELNGKAEAGTAQPFPARARSAAAADRKMVLLTGASGGIGKRLAELLAADYRVISQGRSAAALSASALPLVGVFDEQFPVKLDAVLGGAPLYAVVHAAWPGAPKGGLLSIADEVLRDQIEFGGPHTVRLAKLLAERVDPQRGGRMVVLGSTYGRMEHMPTIPAYSLGKSLLQDTVRLLAPELARKKIAINAVCPSFVDAGMNERTPEAHKMKLAAQVPLGRLCTIEDVAAAITFLLGPGAEFVSGQSHMITGGKS